MIYVFSIKKLCKDTTKKREIQIFFLKFFCGKIMKIIRSYQVLLPMEFAELKIR